MAHRQWRLQLTIPAVAAICAGKAAVAQVEPSVRTTGLPDSPCGLLSAREITAATGLDNIVEGVRVQAIGETGDGSICLYATDSKWGAIMTAYPSRPWRCEERTANPQSLLESYRGGGFLIVCVAPNTPISVAVQNGINGERSVLAILAQAVLDHVPSSPAQSPGNALERTRRE